MHITLPRELIRIVHDIYYPDFGDFRVSNPNASSKLQQSILPVEDNCYIDHGTILLYNFDGVVYMAGNNHLIQKLEAYFTLTRDFYEAILLFTFFYLIFSYLAYDRDEVLSN